MLVNQDAEVHRIEDCNANTLEAVGLLGAIGGGIGTAGGALIGSLVKTWRLAWP